MFTSHEVKVPSQSQQSSGVMAAVRLHVCCFFLVFFCLADIPSLVSARPKRRILVHASNEPRRTQSRPSGYEYDFNSRLELFQNSGRSTGHAVKGTLYLTPLWKDGQESVVQIQLSNAQLLVHPPKTQDLQKHASPLDRGLGKPVVFHIVEGLVREVRYAQSETHDLLNMKKGLISIFQLSHNTEQKTETDVSGDCQVSYKSTGNVKHGVHLSKHKSKCLLPSSTHHLCTSARCPSAQVSSVTDYALIKNNLVQSAKSLEQVILDAHYTKDTILYINSTLEITLQGGSEEDFISASSASEAMEKAVAKLNEVYKIDNLMAKVIKKKCEKCQKAANAIKNYKNLLKDSQLASVKSASTFLRLLPHFQESSKEDILAILGNKMNANILTQVVDVLGATRSPEALAAVMETFDFTSSRVPLDLLERFLLSVATSQPPSEDTLHLLLKLAKKKLGSEKLHASVLMALGSVAHAYCISQDCSAQGIRDVEKFLMKSLENCQEEDFKLVYLRALANAALPNTARALLDMLPKLSKSGSCTAMRALRKMITHHSLPEDCVRKMAKVYLESGIQDSSSRILAAESVLLSGYPEPASKMAASIPIDPNPEVRAYLLNRLAQLRPELSDVLKNSVYGDPHSKNYNNMAHGGSSVAFTNSLIESPSYLNSSYNVLIENNKGGTLKNSAFDIEISRKGQTLQLVSVGLAATGLGSVAGGEDDGEPASGVLQLSVMGERLRPYPLFSGSGELMSLVWSGAGSEPTTALKGNFLLSDFSDAIVLSTGQIVQMDLRSALSLHLSGQVEISIWNRNAHATVKASGALSVLGSLHVDSAFVQNTQDFSLGGDGLIDFITDLDFYSSPFQMCVQMDRPPINLRLTTKKVCKVPGTKYVRKLTGKKDINLLGSSYPLNRKNAEMCRVLLASSD